MSESAQKDNNEKLLYKTCEWLLITWRAFDLSGQTVCERREQHILTPEDITEINLSKFKAWLDRPAIPKSHGVQEMDGVDVIKVELAPGYKPRGYSIYDG